MGMFKVELFFCLAKGKVNGFIASKEIPGSYDLPILSVK